MTTELLALIAIWCEQTSPTLIELHECRVQVISCLEKSKKLPKVDSKCFTKTKKPEAESV